MRFLIPITSLSVLVLIGSAVKPTAKATPKPKAKTEVPVNNIIFERFEYDLINKTLYIENEVLVKTIAPNVIKFRVNFTVTSPINEMWVHSILYYKYNTYQKFLIESTDEVCSFYNGIKENLLGKVILDNYLKHQHYVRTNVKLKCPFFGTLYTECDGFNYSHSVFPLLPAGRFRFDSYFSPTKDGPLYATVQFYFRVSDLRVWF